MGVHQLITEKAAESDIAILQQADSLVVCKYTGPVQVKLNPDDFATLKDENGNAVEVPEGDLADAIASPAELGVETDVVLIGGDRDPGTAEENAEYLASRFDYTLPNAEPSTVSAAKIVKKRTQRKKQAQ